MTALHTPILHPALKRFAGEITDVDAHEMTPVQFWGEQFGDNPFVADLAKHFSEFEDGELINVPGFVSDDRAVDVADIWKLKGGRAPSAADPARRVEVLDAMGVKRQLLYSSGPAFFGIFLHSDPPQNGFYRGAEGEARYQQGKELVDAYNNHFAVRAAGVSDRLRAVAYLYGRTVDELMGVAKDLVAKGIRAFTVSPTTLLGGVSPAHTDLAPFYSLLEDNNIPLTLHVLGDQGFLATRAWGDAPFFKGYSVFHEFDFSPWALSMVHLPPQNFIATMVTGGVFERHPNLRFGAIELGAYWIGQMTHNLDLWHRQNNSLFKKIELKNEGNSQDQVQSDLKVERLPQFPSFYVNRNVRVSAYDFENVDEYIERYGLEDVYCYSSDFPHVEGGRDPMGTHAQRLEKLGPKILEKFFVTNGAWLLPD